MIADHLLRCCIVDAQMCDQTQQQHLQKQMHKICAVIIAGNCAKD
jgi:hypothetical protein